MVELAASPGPPDEAPPTASLTPAAINAALGFHAFHASHRHAHKTTKNGLPRISAATEIFGRFQSLQSLDHPGLCRYLDIIKEKHGRLITVSEYYDADLTSLPRAGIADDDPDLIDQVTQMAFQILDTLSHLAEHNVVLHNLQPSNIRVRQPDNRLKLVHYGLYHMTHSGFHVDFPIGCPRYLPPDALLAIVERAFTGPDSHVPCLGVVDIWSLGVILCERLTGTSFWNPDAALSDLFSTLEQVYYECLTLPPSVAQSGLAMWRHIRENFLFCELNPDCAFHLIDQYDNLSDSAADESHRALLEAVFQCLLPNELYRPTAADLLAGPPFANLRAPAVLDEPWADPFEYQSSLRCRYLHLNDPPAAQLSDKRHDGVSAWPALTDLDLGTLYYLWDIAGGRAAKVVDQYFGQAPVFPIERIPPTLGIDTRGFASGQPMAAPRVDPTYLYRDAAAIITRPAALAFIRDHSEMYYDVNINHFDDDRETLAVDFLTGTEEDAETLLNSALMVQFTQPASQGILLAPFPAPTPPTAQPALPTSRATTPGADSSHSHPGALTEKGILTDAFATQRDSSDTEQPSLLHTPECLSILLNSLSALTPERRREYQSMRVSIRERDPNYQLHRMTLFQHLLDCYPASRSEIIRQARVDIPPRVRPQVWSAILGVLRCDEWVYRHVDKESPGASDKQIDVDIPRCHQYHNLLGSSEGHVKMRRVLKAWLRAHPHLVYWQGLDSVTAPFLTLHFNDEYQAFACLARFIQKYIPRLFTPNNTQVMIGYFAVFQHLLTFHDPELSVHLTKTDFTPQLYAMPWFLTMFTHVFPLDKTYLIWDKFLVAPRSFPHFFGLAILRQARPMLLSSGFNEHITMFTNGLPSIDIEACIQSAYQLCQITPPSVMKLPPESDNAPMEPAGSTTSLDSWETAPWWNTPISLEARQAEPVPRIFVSDLTRLRGELTLYVDIRDEGTYQRRGHVINSLRVPGSVLKTVPNYLKSVCRDYLIIVADDQGGAEAPSESGPASEPTTHAFAEALVNAAFAHVCRLHGGVEALRAAHQWEQTKPTGTSRASTTAAAFNGGGGGGGVPVSPVSPSSTGMAVGIDTVPSPSKSSGKNLLFDEEMANDSELSSSPVVLIGRGHTHPSPDQTASSSPVNNHSPAIPTTTTGKRMATAGVGPLPALCYCRPAKLTLTASKGWSENRLVVYRCTGQRPSTTGSVEGAHTPTATTTTPKRSNSSLSSGGGGALAALGIYLRENAPSSVGLTSTPSLSSSSFNESLI
ncbi:hypothetical protein H4R33_006279 [Dimargaris cristalligena]|nr:hypothetical protein H4R33_006279 [Dimargaris cristalligena]